MSRVRTLGPYTLRRFIGAGAMGEVYEAIHTGLEKPVAIKLLRATTKNREHLERFQREGRAAARVRHPNAVCVTDAGREGDTYYLVMEYLEGEPLSALLERTGRMPVARALDIALPIAAALVRAHAEGVVHRDVKPHNIFLTDVGRGDPEPKLLDFGISRFTLADDAAELTQNPQLLGTPLYLAPEQADGQPAEAASDQYALALSVYECILGVRPHEEHRDSLVQLLRAVAEARIPAPRQLDPGLPSELDRALCRALSRDPAARFPSVRELAAELLPFASASRRELWRHAFVERADDTLASAAAPITPRQSRPSLGPILGHEALFGRPEDAPTSSVGARSQADSRETPTSASPRGASMTEGASVPASASGSGELPGPGAGSSSDTANQSSPARGPAASAVEQSTLHPISSHPHDRASSDETQRLRRTIWATGAAFLGLMIFTFGLIVMHEDDRAITGVPEVLPAVGAASEPSARHSFDVSIRTMPENARLQLDGREVGSGSYDSALPVDGAVHRLRVSAPGYESQTLVFQDVAPAIRTVELTPLTPSPSELPEDETPDHDEGPKPQLTSGSTTNRTNATPASPPSSTPRMESTTQDPETVPSSSRVPSAEPDSPPEAKTDTDSNRGLPFGTGNLDPWGQ